MKYIYNIEAHDSTNQRLQIKLSCVDKEGYSGVVSMPYPTSLGVPTFTDSKLLEDILINFRADLDNWEKIEKNKPNISAIKTEADALVGKTSTFNHTILDDDWIDAQEVTW
tara:strand:- start:263 stop:595 length:333 start_codon:yes stop_codon:yes gene_type:complete